MAILVFGTVAQARTILRRTRFRRFVERPPTARKLNSGAAPAVNSPYWLDAVSAEYRAPFRFTGGTIHQVEVNVGDDQYIDLERDAAAMLARE